MDPMGGQVFFYTLWSSFKKLLLPVFVPFQPNFITNMFVMEGCTLLLFMAICHNFVTQDHMRLEISKRYLSYSFHWVSAKLHKDID